MSETTTIEHEDGKSISFVRIVRAPQQKIWDAFTTKEIFEKWWGPKSWETTVKHMELKVGGYLHYGMKCMAKEQSDWYGKISWGKSVYEEIDEPNSFTYSDYFVDENENLLPGMPNMRIKVALEAIDENTTKMTSTTYFDTPEDLKTVLAMGAIEGFNQTWDRLEDMLTQE